MFKDSFFTTFNNYSVTLSKCCDISINDKHVVYFARAMCEINNNDVGRYLVFTGMIQRLHCDWIQWTERRNNKRYKVALIRIQYFSIKTTGESSRNKLNQNLVFPITSFSCCVRGDYCCPICSAHVKGKCYNLTILDVSIRDDKWHQRNLGPTFKNLTAQPFRYN